MSSPADPAPRRDARAGRPLPIDAFLDGIRDALQRTRAVIVTAEPAAGKTTRVAPALAGDGPVILLQPRRVAARSVAAWIAREQGWTLGEEVGWQVRFERRASSRTRVLVVTEGILTARLQADPLLSEFQTIILDEFHERSLHADLGIALGRQAWRARDDLRLVVMSATLDAGPVADFLGGCPVFHVPGRTHPLEITYEPGTRVSDVGRRLARERRGDVLCFLPGTGEIRRTMAEIASGPGAHDLDVLPLHGSLEGAQQDLALSPSPGGRSRIVVATNVAETSLTVPGVRFVVDVGLHKVARYDAARGIDRLDVERITQDSADQRAGRAGREGPGSVVRLWDARDRLRSRREPEIQRVDLAGAALDVLAWGGDPSTFEWFEPPDADRLASALVLLERLGAVAGGKLTTLGRRLQRMPLHPRLARMLVEAGGHPVVARACALLSEPHELRPQRQATTSDLLTLLDRWDAAPAHLRDVARQIERLATPTPAGVPGPLDERTLRRAVLAGYPDRVGRRRDAASPRVKMASGTGAMLSSESGVIEAELLVALDLRAGRHQGGASTASRGDVVAESGVIVLASQVEPEWLAPTERRLDAWVDHATGQVRGSAADYYGEIVLRAEPAAVDDETAAGLLTEAWTRRGPAADDEQLLRRMTFAGLSIDVPTLIRTAALGRRSLAGMQLVQALSEQDRRRLDRDAPTDLPVPSGRSARLEYRADGSVMAAVKLQELFGLADTPRVGPRRVPVVLSLLAPNGRPVQVTQDLRSFWDRIYPEVRRELRGRYPKHPWPEDPWRATPTARTTRRMP